MSRKKTLQESGYRWVRGCVRAHLDGTTSEANIRGVLRGSDPGVIHEIFEETKEYGDHDRWQWLVDEFGVSYGGGRDGTPVTTF